MMNGNDFSDGNALYAAFTAHDVRFDGRVYVCVSSTGIYCRPVCRVRMPKQANCTFQPSAAAAEAAGFRPCLKCRPELAPGFSPADAAGRLARMAALVIEEDCLTDDGVAGLADRLGVTDRHVRRVFSREYGVAPVQYLQTRRLLLAKSLLADTDLPATHIAFAAGFGSIRRFNDAFKKHDRMPPTAVRKQGRADTATRKDAVTLYLGYRPPYDWPTLLAFLESRAIPGVECVADGEYRRAVRLESGGLAHSGWLSVTLAEKRNALAVTIASSLLPVLAKVLARVRHLFDLDSDPAAIYSALSCMNEFKPRLCRAGTRLPGCFDPFEMAVRAVLGQQITVKAARTLAGRVAQTFGNPVATPFANVDRTFPSPADICKLEGAAESHLGPIGVIAARSRSIRALAEAMIAGEIPLTPSSDAEDQMRKLLVLPGFGPWTVEYLAMRALGWPDAFPHTDYGVKKAMDDRGAKEILAIAEAWRPWRSYATFNLWNSLQS